MSVVVIISNNSSLKSATRAKREKIPFYHISLKTNSHNEDKLILLKLKKYKVDLVILAGYMKKNRLAYIKRIS